MVLEDVLAPARFLATITQLVGVLTVLVNKEPYIQAALPTLYTRLEYETAAADCTLVLGLGVTCLVIELVSLLTGLTLFANNTNAVHFLFHAAGALGLWLFSMGSHHFGYLWYLFVLTGLLPLLLEVSTVLGTCWLHQRADV
mmetsp:Transcript_5858/g.10575  ORF Transcript_5858/g.10575 Transcript_5858/m.10575 type:complete len:142 (-) Transcript_5858:136-561(-)